MRFFDLIITNPLMWLVELCYEIIPNYYFAMILFALVIRLIIFPFSLWSQVQAIKLAKLKPRLDEVKAYCGNDWRMLLKEQKRLYKEEKYSTIISLIPLLLQIPVIIGVLRGIENSQILESLPKGFLLPALSALSAFALCYVQNLCNVLAKTMGFFAKWGLAIFLTAFSLYFTITSGIGFGVYWTAGNLFAIAVQLVCNAIYNPKKHVTYKILPPPKKDKALIKRQKEKQKIDVALFNKTKKNLVFYSEASGFYKYYKDMIEYILNNSKIRVHYLTSDVDDQVFGIKNPKFHAYYCGPKKLVSTLMKLDCKVAVLSLPELQLHQYKRSIVNKKIEYIYVDHSFCSLASTARKHAYDHFDTIFCYGKSYNEEIRAMEAYYGTKEKRLINTGYALYENLRNRYVPKTNAAKTLIIAPSWQKDNIFDICIDQIMQQLAKTDYTVILRPHPEYTKRFPQKIEQLMAKYKNNFQLDFSIDILDADVLISDWSSVGWEFSYATDKPALYINTPMKIMNPDWDKYGTVPIDVTIRETIGATVDLDKMDELCDKIKSLSSITTPRAFLQNIMYDNSSASKTSAEYIISAVKEKF